MCKAMLHAGVLGDANILRNLLQPYKSGNERKTALRLLAHTGISAMDKPSDLQQVPGGMTRRGMSYVYNLFRHRIANGTVADIDSWTTGDVPYEAPADVVPSLCAFFHNSNTWDADTDAKQALDFTKQLFPTASDVPKKAVPTFSVFGRKGADSDWPVCSAVQLALLAMCLIHRFLDLNQSNSDKCLASWLAWTMM